MKDSHYDVAIIGAGMSGLAAGIRLAHFGRKVCIFERHNAPGGLNSFYSLEGRKYDVGLHALTNWVPEGAKGAPLVKLMRQLRIRREKRDRLLAAGYILPEQYQPTIWALFGQARAWEQLGTGAWAIALLLWGLAVWLLRPDWIALLALVPAAAHLGWQVLTLLLDYFITIF